MDNTKRNTGSFCFTPVGFILHPASWPCLIKRIGLFVFLLMVLFGLATVFIKISQKNSLLFTACKMDGLGLCYWWQHPVYTGTKQWLLHNPARKNNVPVDVKFYSTLSDKVLPLLEANGDVLDKPQTINSRRR